MTTANEKITDQVKTKLTEISEAIRSGSASADEFQMPFGGLTGSPHNVDTGHHATGSNALLCWIYGVSHYSTYDGWLRVGYQVTTPADFHLVKPRPVTYEKENKQTGETETHTFCRFNSFPVWAAASVTLARCRTAAGSKAIPVEHWCGNKLDRRRPRLLHTKPGRNHPTAARPIPRYQNGDRSAEPSKHRIA
jgi:hypothetical protein